MNSFNGIIEGFQVAFSLEGMLFVAIGVLIGTVIGIMPGLGPITAIAVMIPITYGMDATFALVMMAGVYYGSIFGSSTSSILLNTPGAASTVATTFDGYPLAQRGEAGKALAIAAIASFVGGTVAAIFLMLFAPILAGLAVSFGPAEYFALMLLGMTAISSLSEGSSIRAFISAVLGFMAVTIGIDSQTGTSRFTFGNVNFLEGIDFLVIALGLFALAEVTYLIINRRDRSFEKISNIGSIRLSKKDFKEISGPMSRHSVLGFIIGILPGAGATIASFMSYVTEKRLSKNPEEFGKGSLKGLAAPETSTNAASTGSFVPLLSLGIPGSGTTAVLLGALLVLGVQPGPLLVSEEPSLFWGVIASMYIGNIMLLILNLPLIPYIAKVLKIPRPLLISLVLTLCMMGVYVISFSTFDLYLLLFFGVLGYVMKSLRFPAAPFILAFVLGNLLEENFRMALTISNGSWMVFLGNPVVLALLLLSLLSIVLPNLRRVKKKI
ncbi:tripartite tricarboxylate transporter permease [Oceanobacillus polygoni]|uniref:Tricarboxylic transport membrane protein n=1 Tax=Oceanobacillus polygoni TaxID=1235259 RepID=A0A9X0YTA8_9BACI|nr:tripartite tricarboxylate transporter permease [Oceanobacillus polygoni]MBP2076910.1 putative tricarboxylic transport membrane protein [Oceanobacillus polygoni]